MTLWIVANPKAGSGRATRTAERLAKELPDAEVRLTESTGDATRLCRDAVAANVDVVVAVGGDGTIHECVTGLILDAQGNRNARAPRLALCPAGTGGDFRKTFHIKDSVPQAVARLAEGEVKKVDVGRVRYTTDSGLMHTTFVNALSFGLGGLTDQLVERGPKWIGGRAAFLLGGLRANLLYQPIPLQITLDGVPLETAPYSNVAVCNGEYFGGGMHIAPGADPADGYFDVVTMEMSKLATMTLATDIYRGTHLRRTGVHRHRCRKLTAQATREGECLIDVDGEPLGCLPLEIELLPGAIELLV
jgi:diacylglycerol kinase (ATP)